MSESHVLVCRVCAGEFVFPGTELLYCCPACGTPHSLPRARGERLADLRRAHQQRAACDFVNAEASYQLVLHTHPDEAEVLWGLALCKYGVEYVLDDKTSEHLPVIHFLNRRPFTEDPDCRLAIAHADNAMRANYQRDAEYISRIQQEVLAAKARGTECDVFLCYKQSVPGSADPDARTREFSLAQDLYIALRDAGLRVFFAHTTLRRAAGANYEAQIFHALHSARAMLVVVSNPAYLNTPWVHSEWSRYLERVDAREDCRLIPLLYDGCSPYALPDAFLRRSIQGLEMSKVTSLDDLRGILQSKPSKVPATPASIAAPAMNRSLLRITMALEDSEWEKAAGLAGKLIDDAPDCADAHLSLLLARRKAADLATLAAGSTPFNEDSCWKRALRFASPALRLAMEECLTTFTSAQEAARAAEEERQLSRIGIIRTAARRILVADGLKALGIQEDGTVVVAGNGISDIKREVSGWTNIVALAIGDRHAVGLRADGTVVAAGSNENGQCNVSAWQDITVIAAAGDRTIGLRADGTVVEAGGSADRRHNTSSWKNIVAIAAGYNHTVGLKSDGTVVNVSINHHAQYDVSDWNDMIAIDAAYGYIVGLRSDGTVVTAGNAQKGLRAVSKWQDIVAVSSGFSHLVGLKSDGSVVAAGNDSSNQCNVSAWHNSVAVVAAGEFTLSLFSDDKLRKSRLGMVGTRREAFSEIHSWRLKKIDRPTLPK